MSETPIGSIVLSKDTLESIDSRLDFIVNLQCHTLRQLQRKETVIVKSYHWITVVAVLVVAYLIGVKYPSIGASALSKVGL